MWIPAALTAVGVVLAAIAGAAINSWSSRRKTGAEAGKLVADAAETIANAATGLVGPLSEKVGAMEQRIGVQDERISALEDDNRRKTGVIRDFLTCGVPNCPVVARTPADIRNEA